MTEFHCETCWACAEAEKRDSGAYLDGCRGCWDRSMADSPAGTAAFGPSADPTLLRAVIVKTVPAGRRQEVVPRVRRWYDLITARRSARKEPV